MIRHLANIVTSLRIIFSCAMLLYPLFSAGFYTSYALHTWLNRATGAMLFITPFALSFIDQRYLLFTICPLALLSAFYESYLIIKGHNIISYYSLRLLKEPYQGFDKIGVEGVILRSRISDYIGAMCGHSEV